MQTWALVLTRVRGEFVVHRCQNKNPRTRGCEWRHAQEARAEDFGDFEKWRLRTRLQTGRVDFRGSLRPNEFVRYGRCTWWVADGKVIIERLCISLPYVETFNSKVIKCLEPELRSRKCFSCFGIPMFYVYMLWTFYVRFTYPYLVMVHLSRLVIVTPPSKKKKKKTWKKPTICLFFAWNVHSCFSSHFCFLVIFYLLMLVLSVLFLVAVISLPLPFLCSLRVFVSMHWRYLECWRILSPLLSFTSRMVPRILQGVHRFDEISAI